MSQAFLMIKMVLNLKGLNILHSIFSTKQRHGYGAVAGFQLSKTNLEKKKSLIILRISNFVSLLQSTAIA